MKYHSSVVKVNQFSALLIVGCNFKLFHFILNMLWVVR